ncbi:MAG: polyketide synthase dehydratase domain-containing protein, partial [Pseudomonadota bacterium]
RRYQAPLGSEAIDLFGLAAEAEVQGAGQSPAAAPTLLGLRDRPGTGPWHARLDAILHPWIADHRVDGHVVLPAAAFAAIALAAGRENGQNGPVEVEDLDVISPLAVAGEGVDLRTVLDEPTGRLSIESRPRSNGAFWQPYARATLRHAPARNAGKALAEALQRQADAPHCHATSPVIAYSDGEQSGCMLEIDPEALYDQLAENGLHYGPEFRLIERCELHADSTGQPDNVRAVLPASGGGGDGAERRPSDEAFRGTVPPPLLDACFHALSPLIGNSDPSTRWLPVRMARLWMASASPEHGAWRVTARLRQRRAAWISADLAVSDDEGRTFLAIEGLSLETRGKVSTERLEDWAEPLIRLRRHSAAPRSEGPDMAGSAAGPALLTPRLQRRGCWQATKPVPDAALLLDELCGSVLAEAVRDARARNLPRTEAAEALLRRLEERLRLDLQSSPDSVTEDWADGGYASSAELVPALIAVCPEAAPTLQAIIALPEELEARLAATDGTDARPQLPPVAEQAIAQFWSLAVDALCEVEPSDPEIALAVDGAPEAVIARLAGLSQVRGCRDLSSGAASLPEPLSSADASPQAASDLLICTSPAPDLLRAREQLSEGGEIVIAVPPMFDSVFAGEDAVAQTATALGDAGFATVCTGWFDTGCCVLGLVSGRAPAVAERSGFAALGMTADEAPETCAAVILLHDDGQEAAAADAAARLGGAVTATIAAAPPLGGSDVFVLPAQGSGKATIRDCVATRLELARSAAFAGHEHTTELPRRLTFLARDAGGRRAVDGELGEEVAGTALSGLVRALANEGPKLRVSL